MRQPMIGTVLLAIAGTVSAATAAPGATTSSAAASQPMPGSAVMSGVARERPKAVDHYVDINSASRKELMTLPGVGPAEADRIIAHRPYLTKTELVTKGVMPTGPFLSLKHQVVAMQGLKKGIAR